MSSELFKNKNILSPVLLDQITFKIPIYTSHQDDRYKVIKLPNGKSKHRIEVLNNPIIYFFSDPRLYPQNYCNQINPCGRKVVATNGRRIDMASRGRPIAHKNSEKRAPQDKSIEAYENANNKYSYEEIEELLANPNCDRKRPYQYQLGLAIDSVINLRRVVIKEKSAIQFNPLERVLDEGSMLRIELYIEFLKSSPDYGVLRKAFEESLARSFGRPSLRQYEVKIEEDDEETEPLIIKWKVPQALFSPQLSGKTKWFIKLYDKGDRIRFEIQANEPHLKPSSKEEFTRKMTRRGRPLRQYAQDVADLIAECLHTLAKHAIIELGRIPLPTVKDKMMARCQVYFKSKHDSMAMERVIEYIAEHRFIDKAKCKELGLNPQCLAKMADANEGFLDKRSRGLVDRNLKRIKDAIYVLVQERLDRTGKPSNKVKKPKEVIEVEIYKPLSFDKFENIKSYGNSTPFTDLNGSALPDRKIWVC